MIGWVKHQQSVWWLPWRNGHGIFERRHDHIRRVRLYRARDNAETCRNGRCSRAANAALTRLRKHTARLRARAACRKRRCKRTRRHPGEQRYGDKAREGNPKPTHGLSLAKRLAGRQAWGCCAAPPSEVHAVCTPAMPTRASEPTMALPRAQPAHETQWPRRPCTPAGRKTRTWQPNQPACRQRKRTWDCG